MTYMERQPKNDCLDPGRSAEKFPRSQLRMLSRGILRLSDFAHKQVSNGFSKKYGEQWEKIFQNRKPSSSKPAEAVPKAGQDATKTKATESK